jgi:hypothetical protein
MFAEFGHRGRSGCEHLVTIVTNGAAQGRRHGTPSGNMRYRPGRRPVGTQPDEIRDLDPGRKVHAHSRLER